MTIYEHLVLQAPENYRRVSQQEHLMDWLNGYSEDGWELVTSTYISGTVHYVFRKPVEKH